MSQYLGGVPHVNKIIIIISFPLKQTKSFIAIILNILC